MPARAPRLAPLGAAALVLAGLAQAQAPAPQMPANIDKLKQFKVSGTDLNIPPVPQEGRKADAIRKNLEKV